MKTVCICGTNQLTRHLIDFGLDAEYWYQNESISAGDILPEHWTKGKPRHAVFQMHVPPIWRSDNSGKYPGHYDWLKNNNTVPVYMQQHYEDVPASVAYPLEEITQTLLPYLWRNDELDFEAAKPYFTSTTAYMIALAIYKGFQEIRIYGVEMASDTEYVRQRDGVTFWLGVAIGRGINVVLQKRSLLMSGPLYGYTGEVVIQKQTFEMAVNALGQAVEASKTKAVEDKARTQAILDALFSNTDPKTAEKLLKDFLSSLNGAMDAAFDYGVRAGAYAENVRYVQECNKLIDAAGGEQALKALL